VEEHIEKRNIKQLLHTGKTQFGYTPLGAELGHTGNSLMAESILDGTIEHEALTDEAIHVIVKQLRQHSIIQKIIKHAVIVTDFKSAFNCVLEKTQSSYSCRGVHHYKACSEKTNDGLSSAQASVHAAMISIPLAT
jgi:hypothetical protein